MRHKYATEAIVLGRTALGEASAWMLLLTRELGLVRAKAQGIRKPGAKLAHALTTFVGSDVVLVRGKEGWRVSGAILSHDYFSELPFHARTRAGRIAGLMSRLIRGEGSDPSLYEMFDALLRALPTLSEEEGEDVEVLAALALLNTLGLDAGERPEGETFGEGARAYAREHRKDLIVRVNRGIEASGL